MAEEAKSLVPTRKVSAGAIGGLAIVILVYAVKTWGKVEMPVEVQAAAQTLVVLLIQWLVPEATA